MEVPPGPDGGHRHSGGEPARDRFAVWANTLAVGPSHSYTNVPYILAGSARGYLKTGQYVSANGMMNVSSSNAVTTNNLNVIATAGARKPGGEPVDDLGDPSLPKGLLALVNA